MLCHFLFPIYCRLFTFQTRPLYRVLAWYRAMLAAKGDVKTDTQWHSYGLDLNTLRGLLRALACPANKRATVSYDAWSSVCTI